MQTTAHPLRNLRILAFACLLTACSGDAAGPADPPDGLEPRFDVTVTLRYAEVTSREACDGVALITGEPRDGEFQYRIQVRSGDRLVGSMESKDYGSVFGEKFPRLPGELINFANRSIQIDQLESGDNVTISFFGIEWDIEADSRMDNRRNDYTAPSTPSWRVGTIRNNRVALPSNGSLDCELTLVWDLSVTSRMVAAP